MAVSGVWKRAYGALRSQENFHTRCASGSMKVCCTAQHPVTIAAHLTVVHSTLEVTPGLIRLSPGCSTCCIPVEVTTNSVQPTTLPPKANLASLQVASEVLEAQNGSESCKNVDVD